MHPIDGTEANMLPRSAPLREVPMSRFFRFTAVKVFLGLALALSVAAGGLVAGLEGASGASGPQATYPPVDHQLCYVAQALPPGFTIPAAGTVRLINQFAPNGFVPTIGPLTKNCNPVQKTVTTSSGSKVTKITNPAAHLACFKITAPTQETHEVVVTNQFGSGTLEVGQPKLLCLPTWKSLTGPPNEATAQPPNLNHFTCYAVTYVAGTAPYKVPGAVSLKDEFASGPVQVNVGSPKLLCLPTEKIVDNPAGPATYPIINPVLHLLCFQVSKTPFPPNVFDQNQFGSAQAHITATNLLCLPSKKTVVNGG
jgi:hypothetical protein